MKIAQTISAAALACVACTTAFGFVSTSPIISGFNLDRPPSGHVDVTFEPTTGPFLGQYSLALDLIFDPNAGPIEKWFPTPRLPTGEPILLDALQPVPIPVWEDFFLIPPIPGGPRGYAVADWHEHIHTPGWVWVLPGDEADQQFPGLFPPNQSLITRNGEPWPFDILPHPDGTFDPTSLWVKFPPIDPASDPTGQIPVLDIHKALLWVGTDDNRVWGDDPNETMILVWEYPTPEPSSVCLLIAGVAILSTATRSIRR